MDSKVKEIISEYENILEKVNFPQSFSDSKKLIDYTTSLESLENMYKLAKKIQTSQDEVNEAKELLSSSDNVVDTEFYNNIVTTNSDLLINLKAQFESEFNKPIKVNSASIIEIRAGSGGEEAALFVQDLLGMYTNFCGLMGWHTELLSASEATKGGLKEVIIEISDNHSYDALHLESGVHRVQRVPKTEASGRIHTSAASVVVLPQVTDVEVELDPSELEIYTYRSSRPGGQSVNTTDSAIRITHKPTGITVTCQDRKSQLKNKEQALKILKTLTN